MRPQRIMVKSVGRALTPLQAAYELKQRVALCLNKLADRDTYHIGADELEKITEGLTPEGIVPFLSCIIDTDSEQKSAVRKECIKALGNMARFHGSLISVHIGKMVASIIRRLKDSDSVVRDSCVATASVLAMNIGISGGGESVFVALVKPFFEALGEQNRYVQSGSALCLTSIIDEATEPPISLLAQILTRVVKFLKNQHFLAKPAILGLIRSIVQAGGASTEHAQHLALTSISEALKNNDWTTRKAASVALSEIAVNCGSELGYLKSTCISSLETCRFDKVKPVRDAVVHALQCWKNTSGTDYYDPSKAVSSIKDNTNGDYSDLTYISDGGWRDRSSKGSPVSALSGTSITSIKKRPTIRKKCPNQMQEDHQHKGPNNWHKKVSLPKSHITSLIDDNCKEPQRLIIRKEYQTSENAPRYPYVTYESKATDDKIECSNASNFINGCREAKFVAVDNEYIDEGSSANIISINSGPEIEEVDSDEFKTRERNNMCYTVKDIGSHGVHECYLGNSSELDFIRKLLFEIETKQSDLLNFLEVFMRNTTANVSSLQSKVHNLEGAVDEITQTFSQKENNFNATGLKYLKKKLNVSSFPRLSTCTPRPSFDYSLHPKFSSSRIHLSRKKLLSKNESSNPIQEGLDFCHDPTIKLVRKPVEMGRNQETGTENMNSTLTSSICSAQRNFEKETISWKNINDHMHHGDLESAYEEALSSGDVVRLLEIMDATGPVLEKLSHELVSKVLHILRRQFLNHKFISSMIPWLQQVADLSQLQGPKQPFNSGKAQMEFVHAVMGMADAEYIDREDRLTIVKVAVTLSKVWGEAASRRITLSRGHS